MTEAVAMADAENAKASWYSRLKRGESRQLLHQIMGYVMVRYGRQRGEVIDGKRCRDAKRKERERSEIDLTYILSLYAPCHVDSPGLSHGRPAPG